MKEKGITQDEMAKTLNISRQGLWKKMTQKSEFKLSEINIVSELLKLSKEQRNAIFFADYVGVYANK
jgi:DNA-binding XRE family transcriptional regulator